MGKQVEIWRCENGHFFLQRHEEVCPRCGAAVAKCFEYRDGDCIACGGDVLCPGHAYGCDTPDPIDLAELDETCGAS